ncbi:hypothetical protein MKW92_023387 [Papaver armeniacum]|nr:hypothetical protein MKW92_023387 [Papaver armeniacum]
MMEIDHYAVLGLPSGEEGAKLTQADIKKAYRTKALELHPDKCPDDPNANTNFQKLQSSYDILRDEMERKHFDDLLRSRAQDQDDSTKFGQMMAYYHDKVVSYFCPPNPDRQVREEDERCRKQSREALAKLFRTLFNLKRGSSAPDSEHISSSPDSDKLAREVEVDICVELSLVSIEIMIGICKIIPIGIAAGKRYYQAAASVVSAAGAAGKRYYQAASSFYSEKGLDMFSRFRKRVQVD